MHAQDFLPAAHRFQQDTRRRVQIHGAGLVVEHDRLGLRLGGVVEQQEVRRMVEFTGINAVLDHDKPNAAQFEAGLFPHLAAQGVLGRLAALDLAARDASCCPESFCTAKLRADGHTDGCPCDRIALAGVRQARLPRRHIE